MSYLKSFDFKKFKTKNNLFLSPMAGITNYAFRKICLESGAGMVFTEMISAQSLARGNIKTLKIAQIKDDRPVCKQIFGSDEEIMKIAALKAEETGCDMLEINASCPMKKIIKTGAGAALTLNAPLLYRITENMAKTVKVPLSVKIRSGFEIGKENALEISKTLEKCGISFLHIHLRTVSQIHSGAVNYDLGRQIKEAIKIPLIVNGGAVSPQSVKELFEKTGADAVSIGRGAVTNPMIFYESEKFLSAGICDTAGEKERAALFLRFLELNCSVYGEKKGIINSRKLVGLWLKNFRRASYLRSEFMKLESLSQVKNLLGSSL
ncbi:MAG: tRNA-dihydrouridine synthase [Elusimicrobiota bacterium]